jgi:hypothetical protein
MHAELSASGDATSSTMRIVVRSELPWNAVKVFTGTSEGAERLSAAVSAWLALNRSILLTEIVMAQSTAHDSHCISVVVFFRVHVLGKPN